MLSEVVFNLAPYLDFEMATSDGSSYYLGTPDIIVKKLNNENEYYNFEVINNKRQRLEDENESESKKHKEVKSMKKKINISDTNLNEITVETRNLVEEENSLGLSQGELMTCHDLDLSSPDSGNVLRHVIIRSNSNLKIFGNPKKNFEMLENSIFHKYIDQVVDGIEVRGNGKSLSFKIEIDSKVDLESIKKIGGNDVTIRCPMSETNTIGVIGSIDKELDLAEDVLPYLRSVGCQSKIIDLKRLRNADGETDQIKVIFDGELPNKVSYYNLIYHVRRFEFNPKRCFRCSQYGHSSDSCNKKIVCAFCGNNHFLAECPIKKDEGAPICHQCKGNHVSCTKACKFFMKAKDIENARQNGKITYEFSKTLYNKLNQGYLEIDTKKKDEKVDINNHFPNTLCTNKIKQKERINKANSKYTNIETDNYFSSLSEIEDEQDPDIVSEDEFWWDYHSKNRKTKVNKPKGRPKINDDELIEEHDKFALKSDKSLPQGLVDSKNNNLSTRPKVNKKQKLINIEENRISSGNEMKQKTKGKILMKIFKRFVEFYKSENEDWFNFFDNFDK